MPPILPTNDDVPNARFEQEDQPQTAASEPEAAFLWQNVDDHEEVMNLEGYQMLSPSGDESVWINDDDESDDDDDEDNSESAQTATYPIGNVSEKEELSNFEVEMNSEHIEKIKDVMKNVTLPSCSLPPWTAVVPEEEWKSVLLQKISKWTTKDSSSLSLESDEHPSTSKTVTNVNKDQ